MKKLAGLLCALALLCSFCLPVLADDTQSATISTTVPATHTLTVQGEGAQVFCNGQAGTSFTVLRLSQPQLLIRAESGRAITQILLNGQDITAAVQGGRYTPEPVYQELSLAVITRDAAEPAAVTYTVRGQVTQNGQPVPGLTLELRSTLKTTTTDAEGRFSFTNVPCGKHSLTALQNGSLVGYMEFVLLQDATIGFTLNNGVTNVSVGSGYVGVDLALTLTAPDTMQLTAVKGISPSSSGSKPTPAPDGAETAASNAAETAAQQLAAGQRSPRTGDDSPLALMAGLLFASAAALSLLYIKQRRQ